MSTTFRLPSRVAVLALGVSLFVPWSAEAQKTGPKRKVHIVLAGLTEDPNTGKSVEYNIVQVKRLLETGLPSQSIGEVRVLKGASVNALNLLDTVDRIRVGPNDTLFMYYHGHGAYDPTFKSKDSSGGHFFAIPTGDLLRKDLWDHMRARKAKLTVLVTETCNSRSAARLAIVSRKPVLLSRSPGDNPMLMSLLLNQQGMIDVNAAAKDESSWNYPAGQGGSYFTDTFVDVIEDAPFPAGSKVGWIPFLKVVSDRASDIYKDTRRNILATPGKFNADLVKLFRGQVDQRVAIFHMSFIKEATSPGPVLPVKGPVLQVGAGLVVPGQLTESDPRGGVLPGCHCKTYQVRLEAGQLYVIDLKSKSLDTYLFLEDPDGVKLIKNDDSGGMQDARIRYRASKSGAYRIVASSARPATGDFTLHVKKEGAAISKVGAKGMRVNGLITADDPKDEVRCDSRHKVFIVELEAGKSYVMDLQSTELDPYLRVEDALGEELARDDDNGGSVNARVEFHPTSTGPYRIIATSYAPGNGSFTLNIREN